MKETFLTSLLFLIKYSLVAQTVPEKIVAAIDSFSFIQPQEKTYVQTDRDMYAAGETIWFKAYATLNEKPTILSKVIYTELVNAEGTLLDKKMLKLKDGTCNGSMEIKNILPAGDYYLRCYTLWMLNFPSFIFEKKIRIINNTKTEKSVNRSTVTPAASVSFLPEGGNLIIGLNSRVAFKATDEKGNPLNITGYIVNSQNEKIADLTTIHDGMGSFELLPLEGETYKAIINYGDAKQTKILLPASVNEGIVLAVDNSSANKTFVKVLRSEKNKTLYNTLLVVAQINYQVAYMGKLNIDEGEDALAINKKNLPPGIMQITVLTENGTPLAERIVFVSNHSIQNNLLNSTTINTGKRKKNTLTLDASLFNNLQAAVAITNDAANMGSADISIVSSLLMTADINGYINNAGYYFKNKEPETLQNLDLVMLTNGWRRFKLEEVLQNKFVTLHYPFETGLSITGKVLQSDGKSVLKSGKINLIIKGEDSTSIMSQATTNPASVFIIDNIDFKKDATIYYQGTNINKTEAVVSVKFNVPFFDTLKNAAPGFASKIYNPENDAASFYLDQQLAEKLKQDSVASKTLQTVIVKATKKSIADSLNTLYTTSIFSESDQTLVLNENINYNDVWQYLQGVVPGIKINKTDTGTQVNFSRYDGLDLFSVNAQNSGVQFFLNEVPVNIDVIDFLTPGDIGLIKVYKGNSAIALGAGRGAIAIYTVKGKSFNDWRKKGFDFIKKAGYTVSKQFFDMDYAKLNAAGSFSDVRNTLYWNPEIKITNGIATINFYNDDVCKKFKIVIEGIDDNGKLLHTEKVVE